MQAKKAQSTINKIWDESITPALIEFIKIPNKSPMFDPDWVKHGYMEQATELIANWCQQHAPKAMQLEIIRLDGRTPLIYMDIPGQSDDTVLLYGHLDKQPEMEGWDEDLGPWQPVIKGDKLYGRGGADDGYAAFASITAINALQQQNIPHARCVIIIEACEESGSTDLPFYIDHLKDRVGEPSLIVCLDSGCGNYDQLWGTTSLRGIVGGTLTVQILTEGVHSGHASGIVPSSFRIMRELLSRVEDANTGEILLAELKAEIPPQRIEQANTAAKVLQKEVYEEFPFVDHGKPMASDLTELILNRTWRSTLSVTGAADIPAIKNAGSVLRPKTTLKLSFRIPPTCDIKKASAAIKKTLEENPPYGAKVVYQEEDLGPGWNAPVMSDWLAKACDDASKNHFGKDIVYMGEGGTIPFMGMLGEKFPQAQFLITGVLGPHSNAHGPNEFLHLPTGKKVTACVAEVIEKHFQI